MRYVEYGKENREVIILLHGGGLSWWNYREAAEILMADYRVILPVLDGHSGSDGDFTTMEHSAAKMIEWIDREFGGAVLLIGGLSLGGQILLEMLSQRKDICQYALVESALVIPSGFTHSMIRPVFGSCYGLIHHRWFAKLQFRALRMKPELFEEYFQDTRGISKSNMIAFLQANALYSIKDSLKDCCAKVHIYVGEKENRVMRSSANRIHQQLDKSCLNVLPQMHHGEFSMNHADEYAKRILRIVGKS